MFVLAKDLLQESFASPLLQLNDQICPVLYYAESAA
jgi:hypothetical protein